MTPGQTYSRTHPIQPTGCKQFEQESSVRTRRKIWPVLFQHKVPFLQTNEFHILAVCALHGNFGFVPGPMSQTSGIRQRSASLPPMSENLLTFTQHTTHSQKRTLTRTHTCKRTPTRTRTCTHTCTRIRICTCTRTRTRTCTHTHLRLHFSPRQVIRGFGDSNKVWTEEDSTDSVDAEYCLCQR